MYDPVQAELISAYVDGQLDAAERAQAQRLLDEQPALRQLRDELLSYRQSLQALPKRGLPSDFAARVLAQAEREVLRGGNLSQAVGQGEPATRSIARPAALDDGLKSPWRRFARPAAWASLAVAAALAISVINREPEGLEHKTVALAPTEGRGGGTNPLPPVMTKGGPDLEPAREAPSMRAATRDEALPSNMAGEPAVDAIAPATPGQADAEGSPAAVGGRRMRVPAEDLNAKSSLERLDAGANVANAAPSSDLLLFQCDVTPQAVAENRLQRALLSQQIELVAEETVGHAEGAAKDDNARGKVGYDKSAGVAAAVENQSASPVQLVYVEATAAQLEAALEQLVDQPEQFVNINVVPPATAAEQPPWTAYNRQNMSPWTGGPQQADADAPLGDDRSSEAAPAASATGGPAPVAGLAKESEDQEIVREADVQPDDASQALQAVVGLEISQFRQLPRGTANQAAAKNERRSLAESITLPAGNAVEQTLNSQAYQDVVRNQNWPQQGRDQADAKLQRKKQVQKSQAAAAAATTAAAPDGDWQRAVFVLRVIDAALPAAVPPAAPRESIP